MKRATLFVILAGVLLFLLLAFTGCATWGERSYSVSYTDQSGQSVSVAASFGGGKRVLPLLRK